MNKTKSPKGRAKKSDPKAVFAFRKHLLPPIIGIFIMVAVFLVLNSQLLLAQAHYRIQKPVHAAVVPVTPGNKSPDPVAAPQIIIPSIDASSPIIFEPSTAESAVEQALAKGADHYGGTANPGQTGNTVIFGHSSGELWSRGKYKYIFSFLDKLQPGDQVAIDYQATRYIYKVTSSEVILPTNLSVLNQNINKPTLTLITCSPVGTNRYRLVVHADQVSPVPSLKAKPAAGTSNSIRYQNQLPGGVSFWKSF